MLPVRHIASHIFHIGPCSPSDRYSSALQALSHALLLVPQNPFTFLQFAETAFSAGDIPLALKNFLIVIDMNDSDVSAPQDQSPTGISVRAWWGVKLVRSYSICILESTGNDFRS